MDHIGGISGLFASLSQTAIEQQAQGNDYRSLWWETGATCERRYRDHDHWHNLRPDALAEYRVGSQQVHFWLVWDRGTMNVRDLAIKFASYAQYIASREWAREWSARRGYEANTLASPLLLQIGTHCRRLAPVRAAWQEYPLK